jgi:hypothetical protein
MGPRDPTWASRPSLETAAGEAGEAEREAVHLEARREAEREDLRHR